MRNPAVVVAAVVGAMCTLAAPLNATAGDWLSSDEPAAIDPCGPMSVLSEVPDECPAASTTAPTTAAPAATTVAPSSTTTTPLETTTTSAAPDTTTLAQEDTTTPNSSTTEPSGTVPGAAAASDGADDDSPPVAGLAIAGVLLVGGALLMTGRGSRWLGRLLGRSGA